MMLVYLGISFGAMIEGELTLIAAAFAAQRGLISMSWVVTAALIGTLLADWFFFIIARHFGVKGVENNQVISMRLQEPKRWLRDHSILLLLTYRYLYGVRSLILMMVGLSEIPLSRFMALSAIAICIWVSIFSLLGFYLGEYLPSSIPTSIVFAIYAVLGFCVLSILFVRRHLRRRAEQRT